MILFLCFLCLRLLSLLLILVFFLSLSLFPPLSGLPLYFPFCCYFLFSNYCMSTGDRQNIMAEQRQPPPGKSTPEKEMSVPKQNEEEINPMDKVNPVMKALAEMYLKVYTMESMAALTIEEIEKDPILWLIFCKGMALGIKQKILKAQREKTTECTGLAELLQLEERRDSLNELMELQPSLLKLLATADPNDIIQPPPKRLMEQAKKKPPKPSSQTLPLREKPMTMETKKPALEVPQTSTLASMEQPGPSKIEEDKPSIISRVLAPSTSGHK